ncbi:hypothetical protein H4S01_004352 [Coemansia sp. RSA 2610]|nr:hypothetical protein H4S01_004352 [Coemansia sp. RSA 2610]
MAEDSNPAAIDFDVGSSTLLQAFAEPSGASAGPRESLKFDPVAQLMDSDDSGDEAAGSSGVPEPTREDSGTDYVAEKPKKTRRPLSAARFALNKHVKPDSVVGRMAAAARRSRAVADSDSESDSDSGAEQPQRSPKPVRLPAADSDSDSDTPAAAAPAPKKPAASRAASKAAMARIHQESERLVRETAVHIDPLEFTHRLHLDGFFARFDVHGSAPPSTPSPHKPFAVPPLQIKGAFAFAGDGSEVIVIDDDDDDDVALGGSAAARRLMQTQAEGGPGESALDAILSYASQPMHARKSGARADGPLALRDLNSALLDVMHRKDAEARMAEAERAARKQKEKAERSQQMELVGDDDEDDDGSAAEQLLDAAELSGSDDEASDDAEMDAEDSGDDEDSKDEDSKDEEPVVRAKRRAAVSSDEEEGESDAEARKPAAAATKSAFLSKFRMPVREMPLKPRTASPDASAAEPPMSASQPDSQPDSQIPDLQGMPGLLSSQIGNVHTQDSMLMTPEPNGRRLPDFETQPTQPLSALDCEQPLAGELDLSAQPTPLTIPTAVAAEESGASQLPTMVRQALAVDSTPDEHPAAADSSPDEHPAAADASEPPPRRGRLLQRRQAPQTARPAKARRPKRSEFVEAEAEEGESSDEHEGVVKRRKFHWGDGGADPSSDEDDWDMDSDEEAAALLADPMIDDAPADDAHGDQQIRDLHRQQDFDQDERAIHDLFKDVTTGGLRTRGRNARTGFSLGPDDDDFDTRHARAERMEERLRMQRRLQAREIHDSNLAEIARNPETAAFAQAALMRAEDGADEDALLPGADALVLEEELLDEQSVAAAVRRHLARSRRIDSDMESDAEDGRQSSGPGCRVAGPSSSVAGQHSQASATDPTSDALDADAFSTVAIEKLIVRRKPHRAADKPPAAAWRPPPPHHTPAKRTGVAMAAASAKRLNSGP